MHGRISCSILIVVGLGFGVACAQEHGAEAPAYIVNALEKEKTVCSCDTNYKVKYPERVANAPMRRGVMLGDFSGDEPWDNLKNWGATLVRHQIVLKGDGSPTNQAVYAAGWRSNFAKCLDKLERNLVQAKKRGMKVCIDQHAWPGGSCGKDDPQEWKRDARLFHCPFYADLFVECWETLVRRVTPYRDTIYGYDLINEPRQEKAVEEGFDLNSIYVRCAKAIRAIDPDTPIIVGSMHNDPNWFRKLRALDMDNIIYQVHIYYPHDYTHQGILTPPEKAYPWPDNTRGWNKDFLRKSLKPVLDFQKRHGAKIFVGEFSAISWAEGADRYIQDVIELCEEFKWDWTYHAYREFRGWSVEYEALSKGRNNAKYRVSADNPRMTVLKRGLAADFARVPVVTLTFDDNAKGHFTVAAPVLERYGYRGTFNVITKYVGGGNCLSWDDIRELHRRGHEITSHTVSHPSLVKLLSEKGEAAVLAEIEGSRDSIRSKTGVSPRFLCHPFVRSNSAVDALVRKTGMTPMLKCRRNFGAGTTPASFAATLDELIAKGEGVLDLMFHGITKETGGWSPLASAEDFEGCIVALAEREKKGLIRVVDYATFVRLRSLGKAY